MSEKEGHYYVRCSEIANAAASAFDMANHPGRLTIQGLLILAHIADRLADLVLAVEEHTRATAYPDLEL